MSSDIDGRAPATSTSSSSASTTSTSKSTTDKVDSRPNTDDNVTSTSNSNSNDNDPRTATANEKAETNADDVHQDEEWLTVHVSANKLPFFTRLGLQFGDKNVEEQFCSTALYSPMNLIVRLKPDLKCCDCPTII